MGKDSDLLKAVKSNDFDQVEKLFKPRKSTLKKIGKKKSDENYQNSEMLQKSNEFVEVSHLNVNCQEQDTGYTPLMLAVQNGCRDIAVSLIHHQADINAQDYKQNTALHLAAFIGRSDLMELLIKYGAEVNMVNSDGNTPLHIACQTCVEGKLFIILKLLKAGADAFVKNFSRLSPLDIASMFHRKEVVSALLDHDPSLRKNTNAIVQAAIRGDEGIVELLLDYGVDPNSFDTNLKTRPLHEAVRYERLKVAELLMSHGSSPRMDNEKKETPEGLALDCKAAEKSEKFFALFKEYEGKPVVGARFVKDLPSEPSSPQSPEVSSPNLEEKRNSKYPVVKNNLAWTKDTAEYCNSCSATNSNMNILDDNPCSFWVIPALHTVWCVLDLLVEHIITGIKIFGWDSPQMIRTFQLQWARDKSGPWQTVATFTCKSQGSTDSHQPGEAQEFFGFCRRSRFWRILILDNYGGNCMSFQGIQFYGIELRMVQFFEKINLEEYVDAFARKGWNRYDDLLCLTEEELESVVPNPVHLEEIKIALKDLRLTVFPLTQLFWVKSPVNQVVEGEQLPDIIVQADALVSEQLQLLIHGAACIEGERKVNLVPKGIMDPSVATFSGIRVKPEGNYVVEVRSVRFPDISVQSPHQLIVVPRPKNKTEVEAAFTEIEDMLKNALNDF